MAEITPFPVPHRRQSARWRATIDYRTKAGTTPAEHLIEEIADLDPIVERGPHWDTIERITIERINHVDGTDLTVERAAEL
ncbi:hypothetical protein [Breoghania sp. JC706]|uniref:hypothetical protein n=1 Tax=Breoghania sp. JC706 TaxID=3117732 RepID=UPI00300A4218